jgi:NhaA family Na+:H+ antiporter
MSQPRKRGLVDLLQEYSLPLIAGVLVALVCANAAPESYQAFVAERRLLPFTILGHPLTLRFLVNDGFMVLFFGLATKEITESMLPGGALNPVRKALNPLLATLGGVLGPVVVFTLALHGVHRLGGFPPDVPFAALQRGWGVPTATDIALAWLAARAVFGAGHPAVRFLLLLAIVDDGIGLVIIAVFYGDPEHAAAPQWFLLVLLAMGLALALRALGVPRWQAYVCLAGPLAWTGLLLSNLHPALALVFVVPFLPGTPLGGRVAPLRRFGHDLKLFVDLGLFAFGFANAGVEFTRVGPLTWIVLGALVVGKTVGITALGLLAKKLGFPLPERMGMRELVMAGFIGGLGLTVALFVATAAYPDPELLSEAKMGALFTGFVGLVAASIARPIGIEKVR